jgi:hypothetical protein
VCVCVMATNDEKTGRAGKQACGKKQREREIYRYRGGERGEEKKGGARTSVSAG